jgi:hypothetical protein
LSERLGAEDDGGVSKQLPEVDAMRGSSLLKQLICFVVTLGLIFALASLWFPSSGYGRPDGQGGYAVRLALGILEALHVEWSSSPNGFSFSLTYGGLFNLAATVVCTSALASLIRKTGRWSRQPA